MDRKIRNRFSNKDLTSEYVPIENSSKSSKSQNDSRKVSTKNLIKILLMLTIILLLFIFVGFPLIFRFSLTIQRTALFMNFINFHYFYNLSDPLVFGIKCARSIRIESDHGIILNAWHIQPNEDLCSDDVLKDGFKDNKLVVLYSHGNTGTRTNNRRVALYKILSNHLGFHVITYDYRGFADSSDVIPTKIGVVSDLKHVYQWLLKQNVSPERILLWGHSLGTAITALFLSECPLETYPIGAVFEAPFTSVYDATQSYPLTRIFRFLPYFRYCFLDAIIVNEEINFNTTAHLSSIKCSLMILHAQDDEIISYDIGKKLYQQAIMLQPANIKQATFISYGAELGYGHKDIYKDPNLNNVIENFIDSLK